MQSKETRDDDSVSDSKPQKKQPEALPLESKFGNPLTRSTSRETTLTWMTACKREPNAAGPPHPTLNRRCELVRGGQQLIQFMQNILRFGLMANPFRIARAHSGLLGIVSRFCSLAGSAVTNIRRSVVNSGRLDV
jgi:hypothetical protein